MNKTPDEKNPSNLFLRGDSWVLDFYFRGKRYSETLGPLSRTRAKEIRDKRKGEAAAGEFVINGHRWINKKWVKEIQKPMIEDPQFETAVQRYLDWYQGQSRPTSYERQKTCAVPLKAAFGKQHLSEISVFAIDRYKLDRKGCSCESGPRKTIKIRIAARSANVSYVERLRRRSTGN